MADLPQPAWPVHFTTLPDGSVVLAELEQDSGAEHEASAALAFATRRGRRLDAAGYGVTPLEFQQGDINTDRLVGELRQSDDRLDLDADDISTIAERVARAARVAVHVQ